MLRRCVTELFHLHLPNHTNRSFELVDTAEDCAPALIEGVVDRGLEDRASATGRIRTRWQHGTNSLALRSNKLFDMQSVIIDGRYKF